MKVLTLLFGLTIIAQLQAQTPLIAYKSHSGVANSYFIDPNANFGQIQIFPENYEIHHYRSLDDSTIVRQTSNGRRIIATDTLKNGQREPLDLFQMEDQRKLRIEDSLRLKIDTVSIEEMNKIQSPQRNDLNPIISNPGSSNPPSFLLVLFCVSAVLMLLIRLVIRDNRTVSI